MTNNTQHLIQVTLKHYDHNQNLFWTHNSQHQNNHIKPTDYRIHLKSLNIIIIIKLWFSAAFYPTTTSSFLEINGLMCPTIAARLSPLFLKELWVKMLMHRTLDIILATSRNKTKHLSYPPLLCIGKSVQHSDQSSTTASHKQRWPFSIASHRQKCLHWVSRYEKPHTTLISTRVFKQGKTLLTCNTWGLHIANKIHTITSCMWNKVS